MITSPLSLNLGPDANQVTTLMVVLVVRASPSAQEDCFYPTINMQTMPQAHQVVVGVACSIPNTLDPACDAVKL